MFQITLQKLLKVGARICCGEGLDNISWTLHSLNYANAQVGQKSIAKPYCELDFKYLRIQALLFTICLPCQ